MSGVEAIGMFASVGQLVHYSATIISLLRSFYERVHTGPERYRRQADQVGILIDIVDVIKDTELLDTTFVSRQLQTTHNCLKKLDNLLAQALEDSKAKGNKRYWKAIWTVKREEEILSCFAILEECKSSLVLCLVETYGKAILPAIQATAISVGRIEKAIGGYPSQHSEVHKDVEKEFERFSSRESKSSQLEKLSPSLKRKRKMDTFRKSPPATTPKPTHLVTPGAHRARKDSLPDLPPKQDQTPPKMPQVQTPLKTPQVQTLPLESDQRTITNVPTENAPPVDSQATSVPTPAISVLPSTSTAPLDTKGHSYESILNKKSIAVEGNIGKQENISNACHRYVEVRSENSKVVLGNADKFPDLEMPE